jgi:3-phenylpropionate/trans-cinnamate dioxygenase ferredoxin subunit
MAARVVAQAADITAGDLKAVEVDGTYVAIANVGGRLYAFDDTCTHAACSLADGTLEGAIVTCPCHGARFDVTDGRVVAPPALEPVTCYPLRIENGQVVIEV